MDEYKFTLLTHQRSQAAWLVLQCKVFLEESHDHLTPIPPFTRPASIIPHPLHKKNNPYENNKSYDKKSNFI